MLHGLHGLHAGKPMTRLLCVGAPEATPWPVAILWFTLLAALAAATPSCSPDPPASLGPGQCREHLDCPGHMVCVKQDPGNVVGACGCRLEILPDGEEDPELFSPSIYCFRSEYCGPDQLCHCRTDSDCPGLLRCSEEQVCECSEDSNCPGPRGERLQCLGPLPRGTARSGICCRCVDGRCVHEDGKGNLLLCEVGHEAMNPCGGKQTVLDAVPGEAGCNPDCPRWTWECEGTDAVFCPGPFGDGSLNACGGCSVLPAAPGAACDVCPGWTWACAGPDDLVCGGPGAERNACGGCPAPPLDRLLGAPCGAGECGRLVCDGPSTLSCLDPGRNACGGCRLLGEPTLSTKECVVRPGPGSGAAFLVPQDRAALADRSELVPATEILIGQLCSTEQHPMRYCGRVECSEAADAVHELSLCSPAYILRCEDPGSNECGGCGPLELHGSALGQDEARRDRPCSLEDGSPGSWTCSPDGASLICLPNLRPNHCGGRGLLPGSPGEPCGHCMVYECANEELLRCVLLPEPLDVEEVCNGRDDDCDGMIDEGVTNRCGTCGPEPEGGCPQ